MLVIRAEQMKTFEQAAMLRFEDEMMEHGKELSPRLCEVLGDEQLRVAIRSAINRAMTYEFTNRGPIRLFIEMMFFCGSSFDTDPQYLRVGEVLHAPGDQMQRAEQIHEGYLDYLDKVSGPGAVNVHQALRDLEYFARAPIRFTSNNFVAGMLQEMNTIFPKKAAFVGVENLTALIHEGRAEAQKYGFQTVRGEALIVVLMFSFGHGCTNDPLYPWISRTLQDERIVDSEARAARLEKKAVTWLEHVNARNEKRVQM
jgi:hypothetical protein